MIRDLDQTLAKLLKDEAPAGTELAQAEISFDLPDAEWRGSLGKLTVNCYLYDIRQNLELRTHEPLVQRSADSSRAFRRAPPARVDCAYCITAWSPANEESVLDEHRLLSQVLVVLMTHPTISEVHLQGELKNQIPPYPTVVATPDGVKNQPEFWGALDQQLKPSLNYVLTLAVMLDRVPPELPQAVQKLDVVLRS